MMKKSLGTLLLFLLSSVMKGQLNPTSHLQQGKLKATLLYLRLVKTSRLLFISFLSMGMCLVFLMTGLILFHVSLFMYAPWDPLTKMAVGFLFSAIYLLATIFIFARICAVEKWLDIFNATAIMDSLKKETVPEANPEQN